MSIINVNEENFESEVLKSDVPVMVDFYADWCSPCRMMTPIFEEVSAKLEGKVKFVKLNVDEAQKTAASYGVMSIPTLIAFKDGKAVETMIGLQDPEGLEEKANSLLKQ